MVKDITKNISSENLRTHYNTFMIKMMGEKPHGRRIVMNYNCNCIIINVRNTTTVITNT